MTNSGVLPLAFPPRPPDSPEGAALCGTGFWRDAAVASPPSAAAAPLSAQAHAAGAERGDRTTAGRRLLWLLGFLMLTRPPADPAESAPERFWAPAHYGKY